jgi:4'-phosphopantetheinyl transferase
MRWLLGNLFSVHPRDLPLQAPPGLPPELARGWGAVSLSHCCDALLVGWAPDRLGVDLERRDRAVPARALAERFFLEPERRALQGLEGEALREAVLDLWVVKEAAIKWQHGSIARDLSQWSCQPEADLAVHRTGGWTLAVRRWQVGDWTLAMTRSARLEARQAGILCLA